MLKTNSNLFKNKLKKLIVDNFKEAYPNGRNLVFENVKKELFEKFKSEQLYVNNLKLLFNNKVTLKELFKDYLQGLPYGFPCLYYPYYGNMNVWEWLKDALNASENKMSLLFENYDDAADFVACKLFELLDVRIQFNKQF